MSTFNNWLHARLNEANEVSYIPFLEKKVEQMKNFYKDIGVGASTGRYDTLRIEIDEIMTKIERKWENIELLIQDLKNKKNVD